MEPANYDQLQGKRNARAWKRQFKVAALGKGVWDVFNGIYTAVTCPDPKDYGLENAQAIATSTSTAENSQASAADASTTENSTKVDKDTKGKRKARTTLGPEEVNEFIKQAATSAADQKKGLDFNSRMTLYKFTLDEYDKGRKTIATAMALLITWVHASLRGQLESFDDPKAAYDHLVTRYSVTDARAREMAENQFNSVYISRFPSAQDYINAIENAKQDILEAGGYCDDPMMISKIIRGLRGQPMYKDFATQYHLLRDIDPKFEDLDHVITQLLTFESSNFPEPDFRTSNGTGTGIGFVNKNNFGMREQRSPREKCAACGIWGHNETKCRRAHPEQRPGNNGYMGRSVRQSGAINGADNNLNGSGNIFNRSGNNSKRGTKPNGMAATTIVDNDAFVTALKDACQADSMNSLPALEGTALPTLTLQTPAKDYSQASLGKIGGKGELDDEKKFTFEGSGVQELLFEGIDSCKFPTTVSIGNSPDTTLRNNNTLDLTENIRCENKPCDSVGTHHIENPKFIHARIPLDITEAFIQVPVDEIFKTLEAVNVGNAMDDVSEYICLTTNNAPVKPDSWILDSGANVYICNNASWFTKLHTFNTTVSTAGQGSAMSIVGGGTVQLQLEDGDGEPFELTLSDVAYAPTSRCNLISISKLAQAGIHGSWNSLGKIMQLQSPEGYVIGKANLDGGLYHLRLASVPSLSQEIPFVANVDFTDPVWKEHRRLGHLSLQRMLQLSSQSIGMNVTKGQIQAKLGQICPICAITRAIVRIPRDPARVRHNEKGKLVHVDIWGPYPVIGWDGTRWMCFITDDATRATKTFRIKKLTEFPELLRALHKKEERRYQITILSYRVDNQFNQGPWKDWCDKKGITIEPIAPYAHHQVGVAERVNRTLREGASSMIHDRTVGGQIRKIIEEHGNEFLRNSTLPETLWPEAIEYAAWLKTRAPTRAHKLKKTPWEMEEGNPPDLSRERTWGSRVYVSYTSEEQGRKLHDPRGWLGYFVGCENESTYRVWDPEAERVKRVVYTVVEDGEGLDDAQSGDNINERTTRRQVDEEIDTASEQGQDEDSEEDWSEPGEDDFSINAEVQTPRNTEFRSRFFPQRAAMVTTRGQAKSNGDGGSHAFEDTYVPPIGTAIREGEDHSRITVEDNRLEASPYFPSPDAISNSPSVPEQWSTPRPRSRSNEPRLLTPERSYQRQVQSDNLDPFLGDGPDPFGFDTSLSDERMGNAQSSENMMHEKTNFNDYEPQSSLHEDLLPPIPKRATNKHTANQLPVSDSEEESNTKPLCSNPFCSTPKSAVRQSQKGPNGELLCVNCSNRYKKNPSNWQLGRKAKQDQGPRKCENDMCTSPSSFVGHGRGPKGELLCGNCYGRYSAQLKSKLPRDANGWRIPGGNLSRKGMVISRTKPTQELDSSDSDDTKSLSQKRDETRRGMKIRARVPDIEKCQACFDYNQNCNKDGDGPCSQCKKAGRLCRPIKLNADGTLPTERRFAKTPVRHDPEVAWEDKCYTCRQRNRKCNATLPINPKRPCSTCKELNSYCISVEQHQRMKDAEPCLRCANYNKRCNRERPCDFCVDASHSRCTYETEDGVRWLTTLTNPVAPDQRLSKQDANADYYVDYDDPRAGRRGCTLCQIYYSKNDQREVCSFEPGGPPCKQCIGRTAPAANRCTNWVAPGKIESVATRMFMLDNDGHIVRDPTKTTNQTSKKRVRRDKSNQIESMSTSESSSESDTETEHPNIRFKTSSAESRAAARERLMNVKLPETFLTACSLAAIQTPIDNALRPDPQSYSEAMRSPDSRKWKEAIQTEYDSLMENGTWKIVDLPPGRKALTTKWVLKKKLGPDGEILKYKARMVARGFQQVEGYDYTETYSGVVKAAAYRLLFALMILNGWTCHQMDVVTAFLNGDVFEEIYIHPPQGYPHPGRVLRLLKALYGLKQSPRLWYRKLRQWLLQNGWEISKYDECVFYNQDRQLVITVYVDDINIFGPSDEAITSFKKEIAKAFKMTDAGRASWYLGMQMNWQADGLHIHQNGFIQQILGKYGLLGSRPASIPLDPTRKLLKETENTADPKFKTAFMSMVGSLNYLQTKTVWGMAFPVSLVSRFMTNPNQSHMDAVLQEFRYIAGTPDRGLFFRKDGEQTLRGFVDSDWGGDTDTGKSTTGWVFTLAGCPVSWCSQRQKTVSSSSTEAEYIAASDACKEAIWLKGFYNEIAPIMRHPHQDTVPLAIDNASALKLTKNPEFHGRTKHINIRHHFIRECVERGEILPEWISGKANPADLFTKALPKTLFLENIARLGGGLPASLTSEASKAPDELV